MRKILLFSFLLLFQFSNSWADEVVRPSETRNVNGSMTAPYSPYLSCLNNLSYPVADALDLYPDSEGRDPSQNPTLFYGKTKSKEGILLISPHEATLDEVPLHTPPRGQGMPEYPLKVKRPDGSFRYFHYYSENGRGDAASYGEENFKAANPNTPFYELGSPSKKITRNDAIDAIVGESLPRLESMPRVKQRHAKNPKDGPWDEAAAVSTLCSCVKTQNPRLQEKSKQIAAVLGIKPEEIEKCIEPLVSELQLKGIWGLIISEAHAVSANKTILNSLTIVTRETPKLMSADNNGAVFCVNSESFILNLANGVISNLDKKCSKSASLSQVFSKSIRARVKGNQIGFHKIK